MAEDASGSAAGREVRRNELRELNLKAWEEDGIDTDSLGSLDASLKRNTAFIKRLRTSLQAADSVQALTKEVNALSLEKYTSELVSATSEGLTRCKSALEIHGAVEVISALHQRFPTLFSVPLVASIQASLQPPSKATLAASSPEQRDKDENARVLRQRGLLRIFAELELLAIVKPDKKSWAVGEATFTILRDLLTADKELLVISIPLAVAFTKHLGTTFLPAPSTPSEGEQPTPAEAAAAPAPNSEPTVSSATKAKFKKLLAAYYEALSRRAVKDHTQLLETDKRNHDAYIRSGEIFEDRAQTYEKMAKNWEKVWTGTQTLSEALGLPLPTLPPLPKTAVVTGVGSSLGNSERDENIGGSGSIWQDEEDKKFYTDLMDLRGEVPGSLLMSAPTETKEPEVVALGSSDATEDAPTKDGETVESTATAADAEEALAPAPAAQLSALFARLPDMNNLDAIDRAAVEFTFLNSKAARRRLVKFLGTVPRSRQDLIPYYARLAAVLNQYFPDIGSGLVSLLEDEFRYLQRRKGQDLAETRAKNIRFLSELTKFSITPSHSILHVLKVSLDDFSGSSLENICTLLETCGRFLLRSEATHEKMAAMLDVLKRKKGVTNLDQRQVTMLENAYYQCDPPDRPIVVPKERTPMQLYIRHLLYDVLAKSTLDSVVKSLRKLHWEDPQVVRKLYNAFTKVWKVRFGNIYLFAILLHDLAKFHSEFCVTVVDGVLENIVVGMEHNIFKYNQQRIATVKYLGELYTYRMVDARVVLDTLWLLVTFGHPDGRPVPNSPSVVDASDDYFRIRLVCTLLDVCGVYFDKGLLKKRMDNFLVFFQMYVKSKHQPLPMDVDFMLSDTFETLRPKQTIFANFEEAATAVDEMFAKSIQMPEIEPTLQEAELEMSDEEEDGEGDATGARKRHHEGQESSADEQESGDEDETSSDDSDDSDDDSDSDLSTSEDEQEGLGATAEEDDEFERELARMMAEASSERKAAPSAAGRSALADMNLPVIKRQQQQAASSSSSTGNTGETEGAGENKHMKFMLLTKKGSKAQTRSVDVPLESSLAMHTLTKQQESKAEQQHLKKLVLQYEEREEAENRRAFVDGAAKRGYRIRFD